MQHQQQSATNHVAQRTVGLLPLPGFTEFARQLPAAQFRTIGDELPDVEDLFAGDVPAPITMCGHLSAVCQKAFQNASEKCISSRCLYMGATPARHRCPGCLPPAAPALDARAAPAPVPRLLLSSAATSGSVLWIDASSPARIPARHRPTP